jgi:hypothetical protein
LAWAPSIVLPSRPAAGGKVNILGGHSIGHSKQKTLYEHVAFCKFVKAPNKYIFEDDKVSPFRVAKNQFYPTHPPPRT